jgi:hypothetical protein
MLVGFALKDLARDIWCVKKQARSISPRLDQRLQRDWMRD